MDRTPRPVPHASAPQFPGPSTGSNSRFVHRIGKLKNLEAVEKPANLEVVGEATCPLLSKRPTRPARLTTWVHNLLRLPTHPHASMKRQGRVQPALVCTLLSSTSAQSACRGADCAEGWLCPCGCPWKPRCLQAGGGAPRCRHSLRRTKLGTSSNIAQRVGMALAPAQERTRGHPPLLTGTLRLRRES